MTDDVAALRTELETLRRDMRELETLRRRVGELEQRQRPAAAPTPAPPDAGPDRSSDRRRFLALAAGTAAAGAAAAVGGATPAAAASGEPFLLGVTNAATALGDVTALESVSTTTLAQVLFQSANWTNTIWLPNEAMRVASYGFTSGPDDSDGLAVGVMGATDRGDSDDPRGVGVYGVANPDGPVPEPSEPTGVHGYSAGHNAVGGIGVKGDATGDAGIGVRGDALGTTGIGVQGDALGTAGVGVVGRGNANGIGVYGLGTAGATGVFADAATPGIALRVHGRLHHDVGAVPGPPTGAALAGDQWRDSTGAMFLCAASGNPGTWRRVVAQHPDYANAGGSINLLARPIRVVDTRPTSTAPLKNGGNRLAPTTSTSFQITGTTVSGVSVPTGATGILANITAADTLGSGFFSVFASGLSPTGTSTVNYTDASIANFFISALSTGGALTVRCGSNAAHCIIDVMGFLY